MRAWVSSRRAREISFTTRSLSYNYDCVRTFVDSRNHGRRVGALAVQRITHSLQFMHPCTHPRIRPRWPSSSSPLRPPSPPEQAALQALHAVDPSTSTTKPKWLPRARGESYRGEWKRESGLVSLCLPHVVAVVQALWWDGRSVGRKPKGESTAGRNRTNSPLSRSHPSARPPSSACSNTSAMAFWL